MKSILPIAAMALLSAACSDAGNPTTKNPTRLWLALDGSEVQVKLVSVEPAPY
jgi:hypothetical protein